MKRTRRRLLGTLALPLVAGRTRAGGADGAAVRRDPDRSRTGQADRPAFDPAVHGFGFRNWSTAAPAFPEHDHEAVGEERVRRRLRDRWAGRLDTALGTSVADLPAAALDLVARQVYVSVNQRSATNGHCYGMVFAAQRYYERPEAVPLGREVASEFDNPAAPLDAPAEPVAADVDHFQNQQFLNLRSWLGRRSLLLPDRVDYRTQVDALAAAVDEHGTAGVTLMNRATRRQHQVLVHDYRRRDGGATLFVYEPNAAAASYEGQARDERFRLRVSFGDGPAASPPARPTGTPPSSRSRPTATARWRAPTTGTAASDWSARASASPASPPAATRRSGGGMAVSGTLAAARSDRRSSEDCR